MTSRRIAHRAALRILALVAALAAPAATAEDAAQKAGLKPTIERLISESGTETVAVAFRDLGTGEEVLIRPDEVFHAASTMKVAVMAEVFRQAEGGSLSLDERLSIKNEFTSIADGSKYTLDPTDDSELTLYKRVGQRETVRELTRLMIVSSSNLATNLLVERVTATKADLFMKALGASGLRVLRGVEDTPAYRRGMNNTTTARALMRFLSLLGDHAVVSAGSSDAMLAILLGQTFKEGIPAGLPPGTPVAHKTGSFRGVYHDAAIVMPEGRRPYVLVVLTHGLLDESKAHRLVADIARAAQAHAAR
jgi:beta-lactamase class A